MTRKHSEKARKMGTSAKGLNVQVEPLSRETLQDRVYRQVAGLILDGGISPGQQVTIQALAEAFHVSAMPVREALKRLTTANALTVVSGRSIGIPPLSITRLSDLRRVRIELEGVATSWASASIDAGAIDRLNSRLAEMDDAIGTGDARAFLKANRAFHFTIYEAAGSPVLAGMIENLWLQIGPYLNLLRASKNHFSSNNHHREIVAALQSRNGDLARAAMVSDIDEAYADLVEALSDNTTVTVA